MDRSTSDIFPVASWRPGPFVLIWGALLLRCLVSLWPYSGQGAEPMYGDYEAQRHWMEITTALPIDQWYRFDLEYWGLDYPPLTAYVSWACGLLSTAVEPASMALGLSRGYETPSHKALMRLTVLVLDLAIFFPAAAVLTRRLPRHTVESQKQMTPPQHRWNAAETRAMTMVLLQPSLVLIDHGHFQYNSVCLGLAMAAAAAVASASSRGALFGSALFSLSLNFKQMALYYAPAFFFFLLASCLRGKEAGADGDAAEQRGRGIGGGRARGSAAFARYASALLRVFGLGFVVIVTFGALWAPFCIFSGEGYADADRGGCLSSLGQVAVRLFPFSRGLFEDKVANLWFCLDVVFKLRKRLKVPQLAKLALLSTLSFLVPVGAELLRPARPLTGRRLVLALFNSSMAFFLCSFQVHEKSLLLPLCPLAFLWGDAPLFTTWVQVIGVFSMKPLLAREGLLVPCVVCAMLYVGASAVLATPPRPCATVVSDDGSSIETAFPYGSRLTQERLCAAVALSLGGASVLLLLEAAIPPPEGLPFLHPTLNALYSCANLTLAYGVGVHWQWREGERGGVGGGARVGVGVGRGSTSDTKKSR